MAPPLADGKFFLKGLKTGGRADGPPSDRSELSGAENWRLEKNWRK
jgi:hypothetical protein